MIRASYNVKLKVNSEQKLFIVPVGDIHYNSKDCDRERFLNLVQWAMGKKKRGHLVKFIGLGDYNDALSTSERNVLVSAKGGQGFHDSTYDELDKMAKSISDVFLKALEPIKHDFLGLVEGHHFMKFTTIDSGFAGKTTTEYLCSKLGCAYFGTTAKIAIEFPPSKEKLRLLVHHGFGSGTTLGGSINKRQKVGTSFPDVNIILMGHEHRKLVGLDQGIIDDPTSKDGLDTIKRYYIGTGSFLKGYVPGNAQGSYIEKTLMPPAELGVVIIEVGLEKKGKRYRLDFHASA